MHGSREPLSGGTAGDVTGQLGGGTADAGAAGTPEPSDNAFTGPTVGATFISALPTALRADPRSSQKLVPFGVAAVRSSNLIESHYGNMGALFLVALEGCN